MYKCYQQRSNSTEEVRNEATGEDRPLLCARDTAEEHPREGTAKSTFKEDLIKIQCEPLEKEWLSAENNLSSRHIHEHTKMKFL